MTPEFLITSLIVVATPGTGALYTLSKAISDGHRAALIAAFGCTLGILPHMALAVLGVAAILRAQPWLFETLRFAGVLYLVYMAIGIWRAGSLQTSNEPDRQSAAAIIVRAILINLLNPKLSVFFLAFLPQFVDAGSDAALVEMSALSLIFMALTFLVFAAYGLFAASLRRHVLTRPRIVKSLNRLFAGAFLLMAGRLALTQR